MTIIRASIAVDITHQFIGLLMGIVPSTASIVLFTTGLLHWSFLISSNAITKTTISKAATPQQNAFPTGVSQSILGI